MTSRVSKVNMVKLNWIIIVYTLTIMQSHTSSYIWHNHRGRGVTGVYEHIYSLFTFVLCC